MASEPVTPAQFPTPEPEPAAAPLSGTRAQTMQRLQVGLFGLAMMILLIGLANVVMNHARRNLDQTGTQAQTSAASTAANTASNDPLADAGVVPDMPASSTTPAPHARTPSQR